MLHIGGEFGGMRVRLLVALNIYNKIQLKCLLKRALDLKYVNFGGNMKVHYIISAFIASTALIGGAAFAKGGLPPLVLVPPPAPKVPAKVAVAPKPPTVTANGYLVMHCGGGPQQH